MTSRSFSRRDFLKITALAAGAAGLGLATRGPRLAEAHDTRYLMGTLVSLAVVGPDAAAAQAALEAAYAEMTAQIAIFDYRTPTAALARLNAEGFLANPPAELVAVLQQALDLSARTHGAFDVTVLPGLLAARAGGAALPAAGYRQVRLTADHIELLAPGLQITLDALAKGWIIDRAVAVLTAHGFGHTLVEAGGDLMARGYNARAQSWQVGLRHPRQPGLLGTLDVTGGALATSGDYQQTFEADYSSHHILDPRTGQSPQTFASVSVLAPTATQADALATALMVLSLSEGQTLVTSLPGVQALWITPALGIHTSPAFPTITLV